MRRAILPVVTALTVAACQPATPRPDRPSSGMCHADRLYRLNGLKRSPAVARSAEQVSGARSIRWVAPGEMVTMDYRADRLTISVDEKGRITGARCG